MVPRFRHSPHESDHHVPVGLLDPPVAVEAQGPRASVERAVHTEAAARGRVRSATARVVELEDRRDVVALEVLDDERELGPALRADVVPAEAVAAIERGVREGRARAWAGSPDVVLGGTARAATSALIIGASTVDAECTHPQARPSDSASPARKSSAALSRRLELS